MHTFQVMGKWFHSFTGPSFRGVLSLRLVIEGTIIIIVPLVTSFLFGAVSFLALIFDPARGISTADDVMQVTVIMVSPLAMFLR
jgi:hypothetical protein